MSQKDILDYLFKVKKPITKKELLNSFNFNKTAVSRGLGKLVKSNQIKKEYFYSGSKKYKKVKFFIK